LEPFKLVSAESVFLGFTPEEAAFLFFMGYSCCARVND
jgi:hypothetical protein